jgi:hypothetical protein
MFMPEARESYKKRPERVIDYLEKVDPPLTDFVVVANV